MPPFRFRYHDRTYAVTANSISFWYGPSPRYPEPQWLMRAYAEDDHRLMDFVAKDISEFGSAA